MPSSSLEERELGLDDVEACDLGAEHAGDLCHVDADAPARADHGDAVAGPDLGKAPDVNRRRDRIGDHRGLDGIEALRQRDGVALRDHGDLGVAAVARSPDRAARVLAQGLVPGDAQDALAAEEVEVRRHPGSEPALVRLLADRSHATDELVTGHDRSLERAGRVLPARVVDDREADPTRLDTHLQLPRAGQRIGGLEQLEGASPAADPEAFHAHRS